jgi:hypothetical protein
MAMPPADFREAPTLGPTARRIWRVLLHINVQGVRQAPRRMSRFYRRFPGQVKDYRGAADCRPSPRSRASQGIAQSASERGFGLARRYHRALGDAAIRVG